MKDEQELKLQEDAARGHQAKVVLNNHVYQEAFIAIRAQLFNAFENTKFRDHDERDEAWRKLQAINYIEGYLRRVMESGIKAESTLADRVKQAVRKVTRFR